MGSARVFLLFLSVSVACDDKSGSQGPTPPTKASPADRAPAGEPPAPEPAAASSMACAQILMVAWRGAAHAPASVTRTKPQARARIDAARQRLVGGAELASLAREMSDAPSSARRGGFMGTFAREDWPELHSALEAPVFGLRVGQLSEVIEAPYGWVVAKRCPVELVHTRHILVRYRGARNAGDDIARTKQAARQLAGEVRRAVTAEGADFGAIARRRSEDGSAEQGGDLGPLGRGRLTVPYEEVAYRLRPGQISEVTESEFGYHIIQRMAE